MDQLIYRICDAADWQQAQADGVLPLSPLDLRDDFVHLSTAGQVAQTLARYFRGRRDLVLLTIAGDRLVDGSLRFEPPNQGGHRHAELFPHFYGRVPWTAITAAETLSLDDDGQHRLPATLREAAAREREQELAGAGTLQLRLLWDEARGIALLEYPRRTRIEDEAGALALEAMLEGRVAALTEGRGKVPLVVGVDNLWVAPKLERRYLELVEKLVARAFCVVARWARDERTRAFFARSNGARALPADVFASREDAIAFVLRRRGESGILGE